MPEGNAPSCQLGDVAPTGHDRGVPPTSAPPARRDPVLLIAVTVLALSAAVALVLTAISRPAPSVSAGLADRSSPTPSWAGPTPSVVETSPRPAAAPPSGRSSSGALPPAGSAAAGAPGMPDCPRSGVLVRAGGINAAMGLRAMGLELLNCGSRTYAVRGYPEVRVLDATYAPLNLDVINGRSAVTALASVDAVPRPVTLRPGQSAWATLVWRTTARDGVHLAVTPSPGQPPQTVTPEGGIDLGDAGRLGVGPWTAVSTR